MARKCTYDGSVNMQTRKSGRQAERRNSHTCAPESHELEGATQNAPAMVHTTSFFVRFLNKTVSHVLTEP